MDLAPLRALAFEVNLDVHGVDVTATTPEGIPITGRGIWITPARRTATDEVYSVNDIATHDPDRRVLALPRATFAELPLGTIVEAPEATGGDVRTWTVTGHPRTTDPDRLHVVVLPSC